ncbi:TauD/TfdA dioxygenase family protein [Sneathiella sp.]|uniref:TauD/TfdA dioxygenase family protein n=1 Tax=Sneathiella sp. TaxID=1964365 RepID=UPI003565556D
MGMENLAIGSLPGVNPEQVAIRRLTGAIGAEIKGIDLGQGWDDAVFKVIYDALMEHGVVFLRDQSWTVDQQLEFSKLLGSPAFSKKLPFYDGTYEYVSVLENDGTQLVVGDVWHNDNTDWVSPPMGAVLHSEEMPEYGGDTLWASTYAAYDRLSAPMKQMLEGMTAIHDNSVVAAMYSSTKSLRSDGLQADETVEHPIVRTHPVTKRKALFVNSVYTRRVVGMGADEGKALLEMLYEQVKYPETQVRFRWEPNSVAIWDNRCTQHYAVSDYAGFRRKMRRVQIEGDRPF